MGDHGHTPVVSWAYIGRIIYLGHILCITQAYLEHILGIFVAYLKDKSSSIKHDLARLCFMLYTPTYGNSQLKMEILEFTSKEVAAPLMSLAAPLWFWKFREKKF